MPTSTQKILLLSDTHGHVHPRILALASEVDAVIHAGDIGDPVILDSLRATTDTVLAVQGNNDTTAKWAKARAGSDPSTLPLSDHLDLPGGTLTVEHGHTANPVARRHAVLRRRYPDSRLIVYGHSHRQAIDQEQIPWVVNPGAAGRSRTYGGSGCIVLTISRSRWHLAPYQFALDSSKK